MTRLRVVVPVAVVLSLGIGGSALAQPAPAPAYTGPDPAQMEFHDVIYTTTGNVWRGVLIEQIPGQQYRIALAGGSVVVVPAGEVERITKERNASYGGGQVGQPAPAGSAPYGAPAGGTAPVGAVAADAGPPPPKVGPGGRFSAGVGMAFPTGDWGEGGVINNSFLGTIRGGKEMMYGRMGVTPAARVTGVYWSNDYEDLTGTSVSVALVHIGGEVRLASHMGSAIIYGAGGLGIDLSLHDIDGVDNGIGLGMNLEGGVDFLVSGTTALGFSFTIHPGFTEAADAPGANDVTYFALTAQVATY